MTTSSKSPKKAKRPRTAEQLADAARLKALFDAAKADSGVTQDDVADHMGFKTQGAVSQYCTAATVMNIPAMIGFATFFEVSFEEISPSLARELERLLMKRPLTRPAASKRSALERVDAALSDLSIVGRAKAKVVEAIKEATLDANELSAHLEEHRKRLVVEATDDDAPRKRRA